MEYKWYKVICYKNKRKYTIQFDNRYDALLYGQVKFNTGDYDKVEVLDKEDKDIFFSDDGGEC